MKRIWLAVVLIGACGSVRMASAAESAEPSKAALPAPSNADATNPDGGADLTDAQIRQSVREYVEEIRRDEGDFTVEDEQTGSLRTLTLDKLHDQVAKDEGVYTICADMKDGGNNDQLDVDFDVESIEGQPEVVDVRIHKVNGQVRQTDNAPAPTAG